MYRPNFSLIIPLICSLVAFTNLALADWTNNPYNGMVRVTDQTDYDQYSRIIRLASGNSIIFWQRINDFKIKYQILDPSGNALMGDEGAYLFSGNWDYGFSNTKPLIEDGEGGAMCVVIDNRNGKWDIYAQHFDSFGNALWGADGLPLAVWSGTQDILLYDFSQDSIGNFYVTWNLSIGYNNTDLYAQKFSIDGVRLWGDYGIPVGTGPGNQAYSAIVPDYQGGLIICWEDNRPGTSSTYYLYVQHLDAIGNPLLQMNGSPVIAHGQQIVCGGLQEAVPDGQGGGVWVFTSTGYINTFKLIRVNGNGQFLWRWTSPSICRHFFTGMLRHPTDGTIWVSYDDDRTGVYDSYLYRFDINGNPLLSSWGIPYGAGYVGAWAPTSDGVITFKIFTNQQTTRLQARRLTSIGTLLWTSFTAIGGLTQGGGPCFDGPAAAPDGNNGTILAFEDRRQEATTPDISAQIVRSDGSLGEPMPIIKTTDGSPLELRNNTVKYDLPKSGQIRLEIFDILGRRIKLIEDSFKFAGTYTVNLNSSYLPSGVYLLRFSSATCQQVIKFVKTN